MNKTAILILFALFTTFTIQAKDKELKGKIIFEDKVMNVTFNIPTLMFSTETNYKKLQYEVKYVDSTGKSGKLVPEMAKEVQIFDGSTTIRMLSKLNTDALGGVFAKQGKLFLRLVMDGRLKLYTFYAAKSQNGMTIVNELSESAVLQKGEERLKEVPSGFKSAMVEYFSDCPVLAQKINDKVYTWREMKEIVNFYNSECK